MSAWPARPATECRTADDQADFVRELSAGAAQWLAVAAGASWSDLAMAN